MPARSVDRVASCAMASGKSASSNGSDPEASMRAVGPYLLQRTLGKGQTGEEMALDSAFVSVRWSSISFLLVWCVYVYRPGASWRALCDAEDCGRQGHQ